MARQLIVVDCETTSLENDAAILEIAAVNVDTGDELAFVPHVTREALAAAQPDALAINRYYERKVYRDMLDRAETVGKYAELRTMLQGSTFAGSNPTFDSALVAAATYMYGCYGDAWPIGKVWHHRLGDLAVYYDGITGGDLTDLLGLDAVCDRLYLHPDAADEFGERHSALGDARLTAWCFQQLRGLAAQNLAR